MAGGSPARGDGRPFDLPGGPDVALLLHGLTGSPFELRPVADRLHAAGARCLAPAMAGHESPAALAATPWRDWVEGARAALLGLPPARRTLLVGSSMGALAACALAAEHPDRVDGLALLAPAMELAGAGRLGAWLAAHTPLPRVMPVVPKRGGSDVADPAMRAANPCMEGVPLASVAELTAMQRHVDALLPRVRCRSLVIAGALDRTVTVEGARHLARRLAGGARLVVLPRSRHLVAIDVERDRCASEVAAFLDALPARGPLPGRSNQR
jgi:carboxylesterase